MRPIGKDITKHYQIACSSMSYTLFAFYRLMFSMCLLFLFLRLFCYIRVARQKCRPSSTNYDLSILITKVSHLPFYRLFQMIVSCNLQINNSLTFCKRKLMLYINSLLQHLMVTKQVGLLQAHQQSVYLRKRLRNCVL